MQRITGHEVSIEIHLDEVVSAAVVVVSHDLEARPSRVRAGGAACGRSGGQSSLSRDLGRLSANPLAFLHGSGEHFGGRSQQSIPLAPGHDSAGPLRRPRKGLVAPCCGPWRRFVFTAPHAPAAAVLSAQLPRDAEGATVVSRDAHQRTVSPS